MPVDSSIHWKPLRDSHYVVASLQPGIGGRLGIFAEQSVLVRVQQLARGALGQLRVGLLVGQRLECPTTHASYGIAGSLIERTTPVTSEDSLPAAIEEVLPLFRRRHSLQILGWYCAGRMPGTDLPRGATDIQHRWFTEPWDAAVVVAEGATSGAFFLHDKLAARWFRSPFYEVTGATPGADGAKATCISWPEYMTAESVVPLSDTHVFASPNQTQGQVHPARVITPRRSLWRSLLASSASKREATTSRSTSRKVDGDPSGVGSDAGAPPVAAPPATANGSRRSVALRTEGIGRIADSDDTSISDAPDRYIELARSEGFFVTMTFNATIPNANETLWLLNEPYSGILLTVVADDSHVLDAGLHYNVHVEAGEVLNASFAEHRDLDSRTIYVREWCVERLRARCRRLRASGNLEREWKVAPSIYLLTPAEWESSALDANSLGTEAVTVEALNRRRINSLPEAIRRQFCLSPRDGQFPNPVLEEGAG